jgi:hypothetical protein
MVNKVVKKKIESLLKKNNGHLELRLVYAPFTEELDFLDFSFILIDMIEKGDIFKKEKEIYLTDF